ncbi:hypothetical protein DIPPA_23218 [Diplonema papillatum]|nr:hypothetical protein DIPPA_23218 [Diplonema papillatum]
MMSTSTDFVGMPSQIPRLLQNQAKDRLEPFPQLKTGRLVKGMHSGYDPCRKGAAGYATADKLADTLGSIEMEKSTVGKVRNVPGSVGYLETLSETARRQREVIGDDALQAYKEGRQREVELALERERLRGPFQTQKPDAWTTTMKEAHVDFLPVVDQSAVDTILQKPRHVLKREQARNPPGPNRFADTFLETNEAIKDIDALQTHFKSTQSNASATARDKARGKSWVGGPPRSTYKAHMREFDSAEADKQMSRHAREPLLHKSLQEATAEQLEEAARAKERRGKRHEGDFATTNADTFRDRIAEAEPTAYKKAHYFFKLGDTNQMPRRGDDPLRKPTNFVDTRNTSHIVPGHFETSKGFHEKVAVAGLTP